jgi:chaperone modulatory protein CbpM
MAQRIEIHVQSTDLQLTLDELCRLGAVTPQWVAEHLEAGLIEAASAEREGWQFDVTSVERVRCIARLERDFEAVPELAALVADLQDEIAQLRAQLKRLAL